MTESSFVLENGGTWGPRTWRWHCQRRARPRGGGRSRWRRPFGGPRLTGSSGWRPGRHQHQAEGPDQDQHGAYKEDGLVELNVGTGQSECWYDLTEKVVYFLWSTERQPQNESNTDQSPEEAENPARGRQDRAHAPARDDRVIQGVADGHLPIVGHHHQTHTLGDSKCQIQKSLKYTRSKRHGFLLRCKIGQHLRDSAWGIGCVNDGQVWEEEVHGGVRSGVQWDEPQDEPVPHLREAVEITRRSQRGKLQVLGQLGIPAGWLLRSMSDCFPCSFDR